MSVAALSARALSFYADATSSRSITAVDLDPEVEAERRSLIVVARILARQKLIDEESARCAISFLNLLPADRSFPRIAADGEGAVVMLWEDAAESLLLTIDKRELLAIQSPATPSAKHLEPAFMRGGDIPSRLLAVLPPR